VTLSFEQSVAKVAMDDIEGVIFARQAYGDSWRAEGGFSAYFNVKRKIDRFINLLKRDHAGPFYRVAREGDQLLARPDARVDPVTPTTVTGFYRDKYDLFGHIEADIAEGGETVLDTVRDLRRYLLLVEAYLVEQAIDLPISRDNMVKAEQKLADDFNELCAADVAPVTTTTFEQACVYHDQLLDAGLPLQVPYDLVKFNEEVAIPAMLELQEKIDAQDEERGLYIGLRRPFNPPARVFGRKEQAAQAEDSDHGRVSHEPG